MMIKSLITWLKDSISLQTAIFKSFESHILYTCNNLKHQNFVIETEQENRSLSSGDSSWYLKILISKCVAYIWVSSFDCRFKSSLDTWKSSLDTRKSSLDTQKSSLETQKLKNKQTKKHNFQGSVWQKLYSFLRICKD